MLLNLIRLHVTVEQFKLMSQLQNLYETTLCFVFNQYLS